jgi:hypothetical protein
MKKYLTSFAIKKMQIKMTEIPPHPVGMAIVKKTRKNKCWRGCREEGISHTVGGNVNLCNPCGNQHGGVSRN